MEVSVDGSGLNPGVHTGLITVDAGSAQYSPRVITATLAIYCPSRQPVDVVLAIDRSGSMRGRPLQDARRAARRFIDLMDLATDQVALVSYDHLANLEHALSRDGNGAKGAINPLVAGGGTDIAGAIRAAREELTGARHAETNQPVIILLSDGAQTVAENPLIEAIEAKNAGIRIFTIGLGNADAATLRAIASYPSDYHYAPTHADLSAIYDRIAIAIGCPSLHVSTAALRFSATRGDGNPATRPFWITTGGGGGLDWTASEDISWLTLTPASSTAPSAVLSSVDITGLGPGVYNETFSISSDEALGGPQTVDATLTIAPPGKPSPTRPITLTAAPGHDSVRLRWNPTNSPDVTRSHISRVISGSVGFTPIATISDTIYFDADTSLATGTTYLYRVQALRDDESAAAMSNVASALFGQVELWVSDSYASPGRTGVLPVNIKNANGLRIAAGDLWLDFDGSVIQPLSIASTALSAGLSWTYTITSTDTYSRAVISTQSDSPLPLYGGGSLLWMTFRALGEDGDETLLDLREYVSGVGGSAFYTPDDMESPLPLQLEDGNVRLATVYILGDVDGNGVVQDEDARLALRIGIGKVTPTWEQLHAGDINGDGQVNSADATMIRYFAQHETWPPVPSRGHSLRAAETDPIVLSLDDINGTPGAITETTLRAANLVNWAGGELTIAYDTSQIAQITDVEPAGLAADFTLEFHDDGAGLLRIATAGSSSVSGDGALATISMRIAAGASSGSETPLALAEAQLNDLAGQDFATSALQQPIQRQDSEVTIGLHRNHLPLIWNTFVSAPDLVIESLTASTQNVQVVVKNGGNRPVIDGFWVDVYIDPGTIPTAVNQTRDQISSHGLVWGVTDSLRPGEAITLTVGDEFYWSNLSRVHWPLSADQELYVQVDSADTTTTYGAVLEGHEISGAASNNIVGPVAPTTDEDGEEAPAATDDHQRNTYGDLPPRRSTGARRWAPW